MLMSLLARRVCAQGHHRSTPVATRCAAPRNSARATNLIVVPFETLTTARLRLEPWSDRHTELLVRLAADPAVTRYIGDGAPWRQSRAAALAVDLCEDWRRH